MLDHGGIHGNAAGQNQRCVYFRIGNECVNDVFCQAFAQPVADLPYGITFLLGVNQIGFGKHGAARGDLRRVALVAKRNAAEGFDAFEI